MLEFKKIEENEKQINKYKNITNVISVLRFFILALAFLFVILLISLKEYILYSILSGSFLVLFIIFILLTNRFYDKYNDYKNIKNAYKVHFLRRNYDLNNFYDTGSDFLSKEDYKSSDLDLFGKNSIYQYISLAKTKEGRSKLAYYLKEGNKNKEKYQETLFNLKDKEDVIELEASLYNFRNEAKKYSKDNLNYGANNKISLKPLYFLPVLSLLGFIIYSILVISLKLNPYFLFIFLGLDFVLAKLLIRNEIFDLDSSVYFNICDAYLKFSKKVLSFNTSDSYFNELKKSIASEIKNLEKLKHLYSILSMRKNIIFNVISNLLSFDFFVILIYNNSTKKCQKLNDLFDSVNEIEVILSFLNLLNDNTIYTKTIDSDSFEIEDGIHPLVKNCIPNSIKLESGIILTGSNMSGKTTFMRMIGVNQVLKEASGIALAKKFYSPSIKTYTSLRINDLLSEGISTFYAEILRMKSINKGINEGISLVLIDEIFKGTNHDERIKGSLKLIEKLLEHKAKFIISTHDFELCEAEGIINYHFNEEYDNDKIIFDYKIKKGKSESKNALYLLHLADIL